MWLFKVLFVLVCGYLPFDAKDFQTLFRKILSGNYHIPEYVSEGTIWDKLNNIGTLHPCVP